MKKVDTEQFYPTPKNIVEQCLKDYIQTNQYYPDEKLIKGLSGPYLDPHEGEGAFLDVLAECGVRLDAGAPFTTEPAIA